MQDNMLKGLVFIDGDAQGWKPEVYRQIPSARAASWQEHVRGKFYSGAYLRSVEQGGKAIDSSFDLRRMDYGEIKKKLRSLFIFPNEEICLTWFGTGNAVLLRYQDFVEGFEYIIRPYSEDAIATPTGLRWLLEINREGIVSFVPPEERKMRFTEYDGMIVTASLETVQKRVAEIKAQGKAYVRWQYERGANHVHARMSAPDREHIRQELEIAAEFEVALRAAYPDRRFVITHIPCYAVSFYQPTEGAPTEGITRLPRAKGQSAMKSSDDKQGCVTCQASRSYTRLPTPDPEFPFVEWGRCDVCGTDLMLGDVEICRLIEPLSVS